MKDTLSYVNALLFLFLGVCDLPCRLVEFCFGINGEKNMRVHILTDFDPELGMKV